MTFSSLALPRSPGRATIETRGSWIVCLTALGIAAVSFAIRDPDFFAHGWRDGYDLAIYRE